MNLEIILHIISLIILIIFYIFRIDEYWILKIYLSLNIFINLYSTFHHNYNNKTTYYYETEKFESDIKKTENMKNKIREDIKRMEQDRKKYYENVFNKMALDDEDINNVNIVREFNPSLYQNEISKNNNSDIKNPYDNNIKICEKGYKF